MENPRNKAQAGALEPVPGSITGCLTLIGKRDKKHPFSTFIQLRGNLITIGRALRNSVIIPSPQISRVHATMEYRNDKWFLKDSSTNGIFVNGNKCLKNEWCEVRDKTVIQLIPNDILSYRINYSPGYLNFLHIHIERGQRRNKLNVPKVIVDPEDEDVDLDLVGNPVPSASDNNHNQTKVPENIDNSNQDESDNDVQVLCEIKDGVTVTTPDAVEMEQPGSSSLTSKRAISATIGDSGESENKRMRPTKVPLSLPSVEANITQIGNGNTGILLGILEAEFACSICSDIFIEPTVLCCGHTFCFSCIIGWMEKKMECPICRKGISSQAKHIELNCFIQKIYELMPGEILNKRMEYLEERASTDAKNREKVPMLN